MTKDEKIKAKQEEIANYERIMETYRGRWYDYGQRSLQRLKDELIELEKEGPKSGP